jgi:hypothetical protein
MKTIDLWRTGKCFLDHDQGINAWSSECISKINDKAPTLALWGDSNAASLVPAFLDQERLGIINVAEFTSSACPPILEYEVAPRPHCLNNNETFIKKIIQLKPDFLLMSAQSFSLDKNTIGKLDNTLNSLKLAGINNIYFIGPSPKYPMPFPEYLRKYEEKNGDSPSRIKNDSSSGEIQMDKVIGSWAKLHQVQYISIINILCNMEGCLTRVPFTFNTEYDDIIQFDQHHLTSSGSNFVVEKIIRKILSP